MNRAKGSSTGFFVEVSDLDQKRIASWALQMYLDERELSTDPYSDAFIRRLSRKLVQRAKEKNIVVFLHQAYHYFLRSQKNMERCFRKRLRKRNAR